MKCIECGHDVVSKRKTYVANLENCVIIVKNVPSEVCEHCGEVYYTDEVFGKLERILNSIQTISGVLTVTVIDYENTAA